MVKTNYKVEKKEEEENYTVIFREGFKLNPFVLEGAN